MHPHATVHPAAKGIGMMSDGFMLGHAPLGLLLWWGDVAGMRAGLAKVLDANGMSAEAVDRLELTMRAKNFEDQSLKAGKKQSLRGIDPLYEATPHFQFIEDISYTLEDFDIDDFADRVYNINAVVKLDSWQFQMLSHLRDM